jgi:hypothetical protein
MSAKDETKKTIPAFLLDFIKDIMPGERYYHQLPNNQIGFIAPQLPIDSGIGLVQDGKNVEVLSVEKMGDIFTTNDQPVIFKGWVVSLVTIIK